MHPNTRKHVVQCPHCGNDALDHMEKCPRCGEALKRGGMDPARLKRLTRRISIALWIAAAAALFLAVWRRLA